MTAHDPQTCLMCNATDPKGFYCLGKPPEQTWCPTCGGGPEGPMQVCSDGFHYLGRPKIGDMFIRKCRGHFHVSYATLHDGGEVEVDDVSGCLTLEQATRKLLQP